MTDIQKLKDVLQNAIDICNQNISNAENIDLEDMAQTLESYRNELDEIGNFEMYDESDDEVNDDDNDE